MTSPITHAILVTGANKGVGYGTVLRLARSYAGSRLGTSSPKSVLHLYLTARDASRGEAAVRSVQETLAESSPPVLLTSGGRVDVRFEELDVTSTESIQALVSRLKAAGTRIDVLTNNAGVALEGFDADVVARTLAINYYATNALTRALRPLLTERARVVNVASMIGQLTPPLSETLAQRFRNADTSAKADQLMEEFQKAVADGTEKKDGWKSSAYATSKAGLIAATRAMAREWVGEGSKQTINSVCPGYVNTDMTKNKGHLSLDDGAKNPVMLALDDLKPVSLPEGEGGSFDVDGQRSGGFYRQGKEEKW